MGSYWVNQNVQISFFVEMGNCVQVHLDRFLFLLGIGLVDLGLRGNCLEDGFLFGTDGLEEGNERVILTGMSGCHQVLVNLLEVWLFWRFLGFLLFLRF